MKIIKKLEDWVDTRLLDSKVSELEARKTARQQKFRELNAQRDRSSVDDAVYLIVEDLSKHRKGT